MALARKPVKKVLAIDWDVRSLRVVHASFRRGGVKIERILTAAIPAEIDSNDPQQMGSHIRRVLDHEGIGTNRAMVDIPRDQVVLNTLTLPVTAPDSLPGIVAIQIAKELPYAIDDAVIDFAIGPKTEDGARAEVLVASVRSEVLRQYEFTFEEAGLKLERIGLRPNANKVAVCELLRHAMPERVLFIDVHPALTEINVIRHSSLIFSRAASVMIPETFETQPRLSLVLESPPEEALGSSAPIEFERSQSIGAVVQSILLEVTRSIEAYRARDPNATIDHVVIGGDVGVEELLAEAIQQRLHIHCEIYNPASSFGWEPDEGAGAAAFAANLGLVLEQASDSAIQFDFLHPKKAVSVSQQRLRKAPIAAAVAVVWLLVGGVVFAKYTKPSRVHLAAIERRIKELEAGRDDNKKFLAMMSEVVAFDEIQDVWVDVLHDIVSCLPNTEAMVLGKIEMVQKDRRVVLQTRTNKRDTATETIDSLQSYRREGRTKPRFEVSMGPQSEKPGERYAFEQDLRIKILDDDTAVKKPSERAGG